jgi:hypothetical protein
LTWLKRLKRRSGYYDARRRLRRPGFERALRPTDSFLVGHPKSGNTWLAYMLAVLLFGDRDGHITLENVGDYVPFVHGRDDKIRRHSQLPDPRVFRNENPQYAHLYPRTIYLMRDPRAVLVSFWRMYQVIFDHRDVTFESFLEQYLALDGIFETWNSKLVRWDRQVRDAVERAKEDSRIQLVRYEDMVADRREVLGRLVDFLALSRTPDEIERAAARGSFEAMRRVEDRHGAEAYVKKAAGEGKFVRKGKIDGWRTEISAGEAKLIETELDDAMRMTGYIGVSPHVAAHGRTLD